jgi:hypothetical protein
VHPRSTFWQKSDLKVDSAESAYRERLSASFDASSD